MVKRSTVNQAKVKRTTLSDVARHCGVSVATVSAILGGRSYCYASQATRQKVLDAARALNYQANIAAKALRGDRTGLIGVVLPSLSTATRVTMDKLGRLEATAAAHGYSVVIRSQMSDAGDGSLHDLDALLPLPVDGVVLMSPRPEQLALWRKQSLHRPQPCVMTDTYCKDFSTVGVDRRRGAYLQVKHLLEIGRRNLAFIFTSMLADPGQEKMRGYEEALAEHGLKLADFPSVAKPALSKHEGFAVSRLLTRQLLAQGRPMDGLVAMSDVVAMAAIQELQATGLRVPDDIAVAGFDDADFVPYLSVPLTTIHQPNDVGQVAFEMLHEQIHAGTEGWPGPVQRWLTPELIVRQSTVRQDDNAWARLELQLKLEPKPTQD